MSTLVWRKISVFVALGCLAAMGTACVSSETAVEPLAPGDALTGTDLVSNLGVTAGGDLSEVQSPKKSSMTASGSSGYYMARKTIENIQEKLAASREVLKERPFDLSSFKVFSFDALSRGNPEGALVYLQAASERGIALDDEANILVGIAYLMRSEQGQGFEYLARANTLNPGNVLPHLNRGVFHLAHGNAKDASIAFARVLALEPNHVVAHLHSGISYFLLRDFDLAELHLKKALGGSDKAVAHYNLGLVYQFGKRDFRAARKQFQGVVDDESASSTLRDQAQGAVLTLMREEQGLDGMAIVPEVN